MKENEQKCEDCLFYKFIDSGFGYCKRFPPQMVRINLLKMGYQAEHPVVEWNRRPCGELLGCDL